ncbi:tRNA lysidine(34) synthetase TilS [Legionella sp. W10-070]|uniref:tRNA lysidine(34) synthetase TilS n=1 Tax=unclassified Legionella TaxID=2622702 RepID=UPI001A94D1E3|nr:tRNA lysidine(34) synthetase TilS [Legionella sp. W10-070]MDI9817785.1 tRNA lysidine(34) synthetase TilS [Legionella sp. PL877]
MTKSLLTADNLKQLQGCQRLLVGYSGGLDSTVLLHAIALIPEYASKLIAVHINHGLSPNAYDWQNHCRLFCSQLKTPLIVKKIDFKREANIEEAARKARYEVFAQLIEKNDGLVLAHHLNDQAETLLLHLCRGTGVDGLAAMTPVKAFAQGKLLRPLLQISRTQLEAYAHLHQLQWIDDESNQDIGFSRNYIRHQVMPLLSARWPELENKLARTSLHCQQAQANLNDLALMDCPYLKKKSLQLPIAHLIQLSEARITNVLRFWLKSNQVRMPDTATFYRLISEMIQAKEDTSPQVSWDGVCVRRYQKTLFLLKEKPAPLASLIKWSMFPDTLIIKNLGILQVKTSNEGLAVPDNASIEVSFRRGGEAFYWHGQTKQLKKLFQEWQIPPWLRDRIPLVYINNQLACIVGYAISDLFYQSTGENLYHLNLEC